MSVPKLTAVRVVWATLLLGAPGTMLRVMGGDAPTRRWQLVARVLGVRHLAEALLEWRGRPDRVRTAALVDTIHAVSIVGFALVARSHRRVALADATVAGSFAAFGWWLATQQASRRRISTGISV
jgi:hypothetical protein